MSVLYNVYKERVVNNLSIADPTITDVSVKQAPENS